MFKKITIAICFAAMMGILTGYNMYQTPDKKHAWYTITANNIIEYNPNGFTNIHSNTNVTVSNCSFYETGGFLKERCLINGEWFFKCFNSSGFYQVRSATCRETILSKVCVNDSKFYQACGHSKCRHAKGVVSNRGLNSIYDSSVAACGHLVCQLPSINRMYHSISYNLNRLAVKNGLITSEEGALIMLDCENLQEDFCLNSVDGIPVHKYVCQALNKSDEADVDRENSQPNVEHIEMNPTCDNKCDHSNCIDESLCNNMTIGIFCQVSASYFVNNADNYIPPYLICDSVRHCLSGADEMGCDSSNEFCLTINVNLMWTIARSYENPVQRALTGRSKCGIPTGDPLFQVCSDYRDQMNCTNSTISPLLCKVDGHPTTISEHVICQGHDLCDDNIDTVCVEVEVGCRIHKHRLCDGISDCHSGGDESDHFCKDAISNSSFSCVRQLSSGNFPTKLPNRWVLDGTIDCRSNEDEDRSIWTKGCGSGWATYYTHSNQNSIDCNKITQFKCPAGHSSLNLDRVCSGNDLKNCDFVVCVSARKEYLNQIYDSVDTKRSKSNSKRTIFCLQGLNELEFIAGKCSDIRLARQKRVMGAPDIAVFSSKEFSQSYIECSEIFGELYVLLTCAEICKGGQKCPLINTGPTGGCLNYPASQAQLSIAEDGTLARVVKSRGRSYHKEIFSCNNSRCITFDKVCNLADDCGDLSDEAACSNNFKCNKSGEYIPLSSKCDKKFDCFDYSDECNKECLNHVTMFDHVSIRVIAWIFGLVATCLNAFTLFHGMYQYKDIKSEPGRINKIFVLLITFGDLLQGLFLLLLSVGEQFYNNSTCVTQYDWTTTSLCTGLGVLSTVGSLVSLFSMTVLSLIRVSGFRSMVKPKENICRRKAVCLAISVLTLLAISLSIALIPIIAFEDYFVERLTYNENPLFVGALDKIDHLRIAESYYGRVHARVSFSKSAISWRMVRNLVNGFFANDDVVGTDIDFYGSNGFCLFSYFVTEGTSYKWFSISVLITNLICVAIIVICYIIITVFARKSSSKVAGNQQIEKRTRKLQRKITILIVTDVLTWIPFIVVCGLPDNFTTSLTG